MSGRQLRRGREERADSGSEGSEEVVEEGGEDERRKRQKEKKERKVDHLARPDKSPLLPLDLVRDSPACSLTPISFVI